jgi:hypothetical protein
VYITEDDCTTEVTSWVVPVKIFKAPVTFIDTVNHKNLATKLKDEPSICTSHFVLVVDQSKSMKTSDVEGFRTRSDAVFATVALDYIGQQLDNRNDSNAQFTDAVTLIEMNQHATVVFEREPCTNVLFNQLLARKEMVSPHDHGMFRSALNKAEQVLEKDLGNTSCTLVLMFLSDGKPSDYLYEPTYDAAEHMFRIAQKFGGQLTVETMGFAKKGADFSVMEQMAHRANEGGAVGHFTAVDLMGEALSSTVRNISSTMSATRQMC